MRRIPDLLAADSFPSRLLFRCCRRLRASKHPSLLLSPRLPNYCKSVCSRRPPVVIHPPHVKNPKISLRTLSCTRRAPLAPTSLACIARNLLIFRPIYWPSVCRGSVDAGMLDKLLYCNGRGCHERPERLGAIRIGAVSGVGRGGGRGILTCWPCSGGWAKDAAGSGRRSTRRTPCRKACAIFARHSRRRHRSGCRRRLRRTTSTSCTSTGRRQAQASRVGSWTSTTSRRRSRRGGTRLAVKVTNRRGSTAALWPASLCVSAKGGWATYSSDETWLTSRVPGHVEPHGLQRQGVGRRSGLRSLGRDCAVGPRRGCGERRDASIRAFSHCAGFCSAARRGRREDGIAPGHGLQRVRARHPVA